jgi:drug/metabolite transporter (DMT)-like permease
MNKKHLFLALLILGTACWGLSFPITKMAVTGVSQSIFLVYRFALATLVLTIVLFRHVSRTSRKQLTGGMLLAIPLTMGIYLQTSGLRHSSASQCAFVAGMSVIIIPLIKLIVYKTAVELRIWIAATIALAGLFVISVNGHFDIGTGDLYTMAGAFCFAFYLIRIERYTAKGNIVPTIVPMFFTCTVITLCVALTERHANWLPDTRGFWPGIIYCALFATAFMYTVSNMSQRYIPAEKVAIIYLFEPVFAALAAYFLLNEILSWRLVVGGILILAGTMIAEIRPKKKAVTKMA